MPHVEDRTVYIVANRLPVTVQRKDSGGGEGAEPEYEFKGSSGGLVGALQGLCKSNRFRWYGWPGLEVDEAEQSTVSDRLLEHGSVPIFIDRELADKHYNGFANKILWPLLHYHLHEICYCREDWQAYQQVNSLFAEKLASDVSNGDIIWIQDYHLMLLPALLREELRKQGKTAKIGFFLHTPFPSEDFFRMVPAKRDLLGGLLSSDLIGFHNKDYLEHFTRACTKILNVPTKKGSFIFDNRTVKLIAIPIGIKPSKFTQLLDSPTVQDRISELKHKYNDGKKLLISVDRLDYIKGIPQRLDALEEFLKRYPEYVTKFVLLQLVIPSRENIEGYQRMHEEIDRKVARINGQFGSIETQPIQSSFSSVSHEELAALYAASDACIVSSLRDGMNIVSLEYIACQQARHGVMVLSEFAGAADLLSGEDDDGNDEGCIKFNPWDVGEFADAIYQALTIGEEERKRRQTRLYEYVTTNTSEKWAQEFLDQLLHT